MLVNQYFTQMIQSITENLLEDNYVFSLQLAVSDFSKYRFIRAANGGTNKAKIT